MGTDVLEVRSMGIPPKHRIEDDVMSAPDRIECELHFSSGRLAATITRQATAGPENRASRPDMVWSGRIGPSSREVAEVIRRHDCDVAQGNGPAQLGLWPDSTSAYLAEVHQLVASELGEILSPWPRVALRFTDLKLARLPLETAHAPGSPSAMELAQMYRCARANSSAVQVRRRRRTFRLLAVEGRSTGLSGVGAELSIARALHPSTHGDLPVAAPDEPSEYLIHLAGHEPRISEVAHYVKPEDRAHVILSGCASLPHELPPGIASATASLWSVDDEDNMVFMAVFLARLAAGVGPLEALRQAQVLRRSGPSRVWAAYVHVGDPD